MERNWYWDNVKAVLIFLVVLGHFMLPVATKSGHGFEALYYYIYLFHMPAFVFVSGLFSKSFVRKAWKGDSASVTRTLLGYLILYLFFQVLLWGTSCLLNHRITGLDVLYVEGAPWYLLCMFLWMLIIPYVAHFRWYVSIPVAILAALLFSINSNTGTFLSSTRFVAFLPFFLAGYYLPVDSIPKMLNVRRRIIGLCVVVVFAGLAYCFTSEVDRVNALLYAAHSYSSLKNVSIPQAITLRLLWYCASAILAIAVFAIIPRRKLVLSRIGANTLGIYILHRVVRDVCSHFGFYAIFPEPASLLLASVVVSLTCCVVFSGKRLDALLRIPFGLKYPHLWQTKNE